MGGWKGFSFVVFREGGGEMEGGNGWRGFFGGGGGGGGAGRWEAGWLYCGVFFRSFFSRKVGWWLVMYMQLLLLLLCLVLVLVASSRWADY